MNLIVKMVYGSHLYGTETDDSDRDYKGIFLPSKRDVYLGKIPESISETTGKQNQKNTKKDVDVEIYSLHHFLKLACQGQTVAIDLLHSSPHHWITYSPLWIELYNRRSWFYSKNLTAFVGYARRQASKYGIKGSRLDAAKQAHAHLAKFSDETRVRDIWHTLWANDYCHFLDNGVHRIWQVCGKGVSETASTFHARQMLEKFITTYGDRARKADANEGIDWKAVSHALRAGYEARIILSGRILSFPLPEVDFLRSVKLGQRHYKREVAPELERLMDELEQLAKTCILPKKVNVPIVEAWLIQTLNQAFHKEERDRMAALLFDEKVHDYDTL